MEGWVKIGVQRASVLYPNSCYNEPCYIEVQVYSFSSNSASLSIFGCIVWHFNHEKCQFILTFYYEKGRYTTGVKERQ